MSFGFVDPWHLFVPREGGHVVGLAGSGGRRNLLAAVAALLEREGVPVALTSLAAHEPLPAATALAWDDLAAGARPPAGTVHVHGGTGPDGRCRGLAPAEVDDLGGLLPDHVVLFLREEAVPTPLRLPEAAPSAWPARTSLILLVVGVDAVGGRLDGAVDAAAAGRFGPWRDLPGHTVLTWEHVETLLLAPDGLLAELPAGVPAVLGLGGLAGQDDSIGLFSFCDRAMDVPELPLVVFCSQGPEEPEFRTACREELENV